MDLTDDAFHPSPPQDLDLQSLPLDPLAPKADQTPTPSLEPPLRDSAPSTNSILGSPSKTRPSSVIATKNTRKRMEDRHVVLHDLKAYLPSALQNKIDPLEHVSYYAVFDGHAGTDAAAYAAAHLHELLVESQAYPADPVQAFKEAFVTCDKDFVATSKKSGSTAICALIKGEMLYTSWLGDSQATLVRAGVPIKIVDSHKPNRDDERARIEALGGSIMHWGTWRVNGQLAVSRAIGDGEYKPYISADTDVTTVVMNGSEEFLIVGCDGLWDTVTPEEATDIVFDYLEEKKAEGGDIENISARLATIAKEKGSGDNITIIVVFLKPVEEVISLGKLTNRSSGSAEPDIAGITSTSDFVFSTGGRDSLEPSKDKPDFTSPNVSFANPEGGAMFSPDPFGHAGSLGNGFNLSSENFDNNIEDKRFSNESNERISEEAFNNDHMAELLKKQSIDKVDDLLKMLDREDSSPTPENDDAIPLEEILARGREQPEDQVDGVEDDLDSSDDEIVELRRNGNGGNSSSSSGNSQLEEVLKLDDRKLSDDLVDDSSPSTPSNGLPVFPEPTMDPCEQVTVEATGPVEYGTVVPPTQELPSHQQPVIEIVDTMTCSMVKEENPDQEGNGETNGVGDAVTFEGADGEEGFMLKTPDEEEQQLAEFTPEVERERETSVDTFESVDDHQAAAPAAHPTSLDLSAPSIAEAGSSGGLDIPNVQITPATPTRALSPEHVIPKPVEKENKSEPEPAAAPAVAVVPSITTTEPTPEKPLPTKTPNKTPKGPTAAAKSAGSNKPSPGRTSKAGTPTASKTATPQAKTTATKSAVGATAKPGSKPTTTTAPKSAGSRPTSSTVGARPKPSEASKPVGLASRTTKPTKPAADTTKPTEAAKRPTKPLTSTARTTERKPLATKPSENGPAKPTTKPTVPRTIPSKPKQTEIKTADTKSDPPKRPTSSTAPRPPATKSSASGRTTVSRQPSNASSTSSARPRPAVSKTTTATTSRVAASKPAPGAAPRASTAPTKTGTGLSRSSSSATTRPSSSTTASRAAASTTAVKPTAAASRVAAARAAAKAQKPGAVKAKVPAAAGTTVKKSADKPENKTENGEATGTNGAPESIPDIAPENPVDAGNNENTEVVLETLNKNVVTGEETSGSGEQVTEEVGPHLNGVKEIEQSSEC